MYGKLFDSMYDGTLRENWEALVTFQQMIVLCNADGVTDMTPSAIAGRTGIPIEVIEKGISILESPDPNSRTPDEEGRRIVRIDDHRAWGWVIVNHAKYRNFQDLSSVREQTRERVRRHREKKRSETDGNDAVTHGNGQKRHTDTNTNKEEIVQFADWYARYPRKEARANAEKAWKSLKNGDRERAFTALEAWPFSTEKKFIPLPASWLRGRRWEDQDPQPQEPARYVR